MRTSSRVRRPLRLRRSCFGCTGRGYVAVPSAPRRFCSKAPSAEDRFTHNAFGSRPFSQESRKRHYKDLFLYLFFIAFYFRLVPKPRTPRPLGALPWPLRNPAERTAPRAYHRPRGNAPLTILCPLPAACCTTSVTPQTPSPSRAPSTTVLSPRCALRPRDANPAAPSLMPSRAPVSAHDLLPRA